MWASVFSNMAEKLDASFRMTRPQASLQKNRLVSGKLVARQIFSPFFPDKKTAVVFENGIMNDLR